MDKRDDLPPMRETKIDDSLTFAFGERVKRYEEDGDFGCRLILRESQRMQVKCIEFGPDGLADILKHARTIPSLIHTRLKALIFQNPDVQVYVLNENEKDGFLVHFQDRYRIKISLTLERFQRLLRHVEEAEREFVRFSAKRRAKRNKKLKKIGHNCTKPEEGAASPIPNGHRSSFKI